MASVRNDDAADWQTASVLGTIRGIQWWAAVLLALAFAGIGVFVDLQRLDKLGMIFQVCYFAGCLLAVLWVQRRGLFGPMVQPPLILAIAVPGVVYVNGGASGAGMTAKALALGTPLINGFPTMAITTGATVLVGAFRLVTQRAPKTKTISPSRSTAGRRPAKPAGPPPSGRPTDDPLGPPVNQPSGRPGRSARPPRQDPRQPPRRR